MHSIQVELPAGLQPGDIKSRLLHHVAGFPYSMFLDSGGFEDTYGKYEWIAAWSAKPSALFTIDQIRKKDGRWKFGVLTFELKNRLLPHLATTSQQFISFPDLAFFVPEHVVWQERGNPRIMASGGDGIHAELAAAFGKQPPNTPDHQVMRFRPDTGREEYIRKVEALRQHIKEGDCYEINFCREWKAQGRLNHPAAWFEKLMNVSPVPFGMFLRWDNTYVLSASPERFICHRDGLLVTQPIKGTARRGASPEEDKTLAQSLARSEKDRAENVMIVDLSRNDLYPSCDVNSVAVPELFAVRTYPLVHQLVSTITGRLSPYVSPIDAMLKAFPPGSMTGAPKLRVCQLTEQYEKSARGIYSGAAGYIDPEQNLDLNVVIRTLLYDDAEGQLSYHAGGAITWDSDPAGEYEETLVKASVLARLFGADALEQDL